MSWSSASAARQLVRQHTVFSQADSTTSFYLTGDYLPLRPDNSSTQLTKHGNLQLRTIRNTQNKVSVGNAAIDLPVVPARAWFSRALVCGPAPPPDWHPGRLAPLSTRGSASPGLPSGCQSPRSVIKTNTETFKIWTELILDAVECFLIGNLHTNTVTPHTHVSKHARTQAHLHTHT